ncbi:MAG: hypothetical protein AB1540_01495 [Bdellovibrionota bacterium]
MDVTESQARREVELANRLLRNREDEHAREIEGMREKQRQQIDRLEQTQQENIKEVQEKSNHQLGEARENFKEQLGKEGDTYEKSLSEERRQNYDRLGRLISEQTRERDRDREMQNGRFNDLIESTSRNVDGERTEREARYKKVRDTFEQDRQELKSYFDRKLSLRNQAHDEAMGQIVANARHHVDDNIRKNGDELAKEKLGAELKYRKLAEESAADRGNMKRSYDLREQQLTDEKNLIGANVGKDMGKSFEGYRERMSDTVRKLIDENHFQNAQADRENANRIALSEQEHQSKLQEQRSQFKKRENDLQYQLVAEKDRNALKDTLDERRHKQDVFLNSDAIRKNNDLSRNMLQMQHTDQTRAKDDKHQRETQEQANTFKKRINEQELNAIEERNQLIKQNQHDKITSTQKHEEEKRNIAKAVMDQEESLTESRNRELEYQRNYYNDTISSLRQGNQKEMARAARENRNRVHQLQETLRVHSQEYEMTQRSNQLQNEDLMKARAKRLTDSYSKALIRQKESHDEITENLKYDSMQQLARLRTETDHEKRMQMLELQNKNRLLLTASEAKVNQLKEYHAAETQKVKDESEKAVRDVLRKTKEAMDKERLMHTRELEAKDQQMKEKLRVQEEAFKETLEKIKRTHELALKKS